MPRSLLAAALAASLALPAAGQPPRFEAFWEFLASLWSAVSLDEGCGMDPSGRCAPARLEADAGCGADPSGRCAPARLEADEGCGADPNGRCAPARLEADAGCGADPNGRCAPAR
jgi:hypothetical protein